MTERPSLDQLATEILSKRGSTLARKASDPERSNVIVALYLLGASQPQLAVLYGIKRESVKSLLVRKLSPTMRATARPSALHKPMLSQEQVALYRDWYLSHRIELSGMDPITLAAKMKTAAPPLED